jgi:hypothetical protein
MVFIGDKVIFRDSHNDAVREGIISAIAPEYFRIRIGRWFPRLIWIKKEQLISGYQDQLVTRTF